MVKITLILLTLLLSSCAELRENRSLSSVDNDEKFAYTIESDDRYPSMIGAQNEIFLSKELSRSEKSKKAEVLKKSQFDSFVNELSIEERKSLNDVFFKIKNSQSTLTQMIQGSGNPVLLIHGLDFENFPFEYLRPIHSLIGRQRNSFAFRWNKRDSIDKNSDQLIESLKKIMDLFPDHEVTVFAYSAGGGVALLALDKIKEDSFYSKISLHTIASPIYGYGAPDGAFIAIPFVGSSTIAIGKGINKKLIHSKLNQCHHWINTNCELDHHTCEYKGINPQLGPVASDVKNLPCGSENTTLFNDENHASILNRVFFQVLGN